MGGGHLRRVVVAGFCVTGVLLVFVSLHTPVKYAEEQEEHVRVLERRPAFNVVIKLLTYNRLHSLTRCLESLASADYGAHVVKLHVFIDHFPLSDAPPLPPAAVEGKLKEAHDLVSYADQFAWIHGPKEIHYRTRNAGLQGQWLEAWWPASDHEFAFVVEDDMRLSPFYFKYLRRIIEMYYYNPSNYDPSVYGISLQRPRFVPGKHGNRLQLEDSTRLFLYQLVGTWGQLLFPKPWKEFRLWYDVHKSMNSKPILDGMITTGWYHRSKERIWTPWFIKFAHCKGYYNLYTHFPNEQALSVSYRDKGVNTKTGAGPDSNLIGNGSLSEMHFWEMKPLTRLKRYDFCFREVIQGRLIKNAKDVYNIAPFLRVNGIVILVNAVGFSEEVTRNWLCHFSKLGIRNYVLLLQDHKLEQDLLRRGHAVMHVFPQLLEKGFGQQNQHIQNFLGIAQAVTWVLQADCNVWMTRVDTLWAANPFPRIKVENTDVLGFAAGIGISTELLYIKCSKGTLSLWRNIFKDLSFSTESLTRFRSFKLDEYSNVEALLIGQLVSRGALQVKTLPLTLKADIFTLHQNQIELPTALLTGIPINESYISVIRSLGWWMLDSELSCTGIYCSTFR